MTNDTTTLSGALLEMKDQLIYELGQKGVTATYDPNTGLLGLISKISDIQTGGGGGGVPCYNVSFTDKSLSYGDYDFSANAQKGDLEIYLQYQYAPYEGGVVTLTDGTNTYSLTTDANGKATLKPTLASASTTFTASYTNTSASKTVNESTYHHIDKCDNSNNMNLYDSSTLVYEASTATNHPTCAISYNSTQNAYDIHTTTSSTTSYYSMIPIIATAGKTNYIVDMWFKQNKSYSSNEVGLFVINTQGGTSDKGYGISANTYYNRFYGKALARNSSSTTTVDITAGTMSVGTWYHLRLKVTDAKMEGWMFDSNGNQWGYVSSTASVPNKQLGILQRGGSASNTTNYIKEIKVRSIA